MKSIEHSARACEEMTSVSLQLRSSARGFSRLEIRHSRTWESNHSIVSFEVFAQAAHSETRVSSLDLQKELGGGQLVAEIERRRSVRRHNELKILLDLLVSS